MRKEKQWCQNNGVGLGCEMLTPARLQPWRTTSSASCSDRRLMFFGLRSAKARITRGGYVVAVHHAYGIVIAILARRYRHASHNLLSTSLPSFSSRRWQAYSRRPPRLQQWLRRRPGGRSLTRVSNAGGACFGEYGRGDIGATGRILPRGRGDHIL